MSVRRWSASPGGLAALSAHSKPRLASWSDIARAPSSTQTAADADADTSDNTVAELRAPMQSIGCALLNASQQLNVSLLRCGQQGRQHCDGGVTLPRLILHVVQHSSRMVPPAWQFTSAASARHVWARSLGCPPGLAAWECMLGQPDASSVLSTRCDRRNETALRNKTLVMLQLLRWIVLDGWRGSPLLERGPVRPAWPAARPIARVSSGLRRINVSVHVRMGDACDVVENTTLSEPPWHRWNPHRKPIAHTRHAVSRHCASEQVYVQTVLNLLQRLRSSRPRTVVDAVLLATDSAAAVGAFRASLAGQGTVLLVRNFDRGQFEYRPRGWAQQDQWIEHRNRTNADTTVSILEDLRFLSGGHFFVGSMCSQTSLVAWNVMVARHGETLPFISVDPCVPYLDPYAFAAKEGRCATSWASLAGLNERFDASCVQSIIPRVFTRTLHQT